MRLTEGVYHDIARDANLHYGHSDAYVKFMLDRFPDEGSRAYAEEWAYRFRNGTAFAHADNDSMQALKRAYGIR